MAGFLFFIALGIWTILAIVVAVRARQLGFSFFEFLIYGLIALPFAMLAVIFAKEPVKTESARRTNERTVPFRNRAGVTFMRSATLAGFAGAGLMAATAPGQFISSLEATAKHGVEFDECVASSTLSDCTPTGSVALVSAAVADTLPGSWFGYDPLRNDLHGPTDVPASTAVAGARAAETAETPAVAVSPAGTTETDTATVSENMETDTVATAAALEAKAEFKPTSTQVRLVQTYLSELGYDPGEIDGKFGGQTATAIRTFERRMGRKVTGKISLALIDTLDTKFAMASMNPAGELARDTAQQMDEPQYNRPSYRNEALALNDTAEEEPRSTYRETIIKREEAPRSVQRNTVQHSAPAARPLRLTKPLRLSR